MVSIYLDKNITEGKINKLDLLHESDREFLNDKRGVRALLFNDRMDALGLVCAFPIKKTEYGCYLIPTKKFKQYGFRAARKLKNELNKFIREAGGCVMQTVCREDIMIERWMQFLNFEKLGRINIKGERFHIWRR